MQSAGLRSIVRLAVFAVAGVSVSTSWASDASQVNLQVVEPDAPLTTVSQVVEAARGNPRQLLRDSLAQCNALDGYEILFHVREKTGFWGGMSDWAKIHVYYRRDPHAIKMVWLSGNDYREALYINGHNNNKMTVLPKEGTLGLRPKPMSIAPQTAVTMGRTLRPITDFGLAELLQVTLDGIERAGSAGGAKVIYSGLDAPPDLEERAHRVTIVYPRGFADADRQDIYISTQTGYPIAAYFWEPDGDLLATYLYGSPRPPAPPMSAFRLSRG
jgi:hypothetical protein